MFRYIKSLQKQSELLRQRIAFLVAFIITGIIVIAWIGILNIESSTSIYTQASTEEASLETKFDSTPFSVIAEEFRSLGDLFNRQ